MSNTVNKSSKDWKLIIGFIIMEVTDDLDIIYL